MAYLNCTLGLLERHIYYPFQAGVDKEITRTFLQGQVCLQKNISIYVL